MDKLTQHQELILKILLCGILLGTVGFLMALFFKYLSLTFGVYLSVVLVFIGCSLGFVGGCMIVFESLTEK